MLRILTGLFAILIAVQGSAQTQPAPAPPTVWDLEWQDSHCTITTGSAKTVGLSLWMTPGDPDPDLYVVGPPDIVPPQLAGPPPPPWSSKPITVTLAPGGETFPAEIYVKSAGKPTVLGLRKLKHQFPAAFARSSEVRVPGAKGPLAIPINGSAKAMAALQDCIDNKLKEWGIDAQAFAALRPPPTALDNYHVYSADDYPRDALDANWAGQAVARVNVDATGKVTGCAIVVSSGWKSVDDVTCRRALEKGRYNPAIGPDGRPTAAVRTENVVFNIAQ